MLSIENSYFLKISISTCAMWLMVQTAPAGDDSRTDDSSKISQKHLEQVHDMVADAMLDLPPAPNIKGLLGIYILQQITTSN